jgi:hypothetical protein
MERLRVLDLKKLSLWEQHGHSVLATEEEFLGIGGLDRVRIIISE